MSSIAETNDNDAMLSIAESDKDALIAILEAQLKTAKAAIVDLNDELLEVKKDLQIIAVWFRDNGYVTDADLEEARAASNIVVLHEQH